MSRQKEVLLLIPQMAGGGAERVLGILADGFAAAGYDTTLMITNQRKCDMVGYEVSNGVSVVSLKDSLGKEKKSLKYTWMKLTSCAGGKICELRHKPASDKLAYRTFLWQYHRFVEELRKYLLAHPDTEVVAFLQPIVNAVLLAADGLPNRVIISERLDPARYAKNRYMPYFAKKWYPTAHCIVFQTESAQSYFPAEIKEKSAVIYNPLNPKLPEAYSGTRRHTVVNFCRITAQKNLPLLVDAFALFRRAYPDYNLEIWGEGEAASDIRAYITEKGMDGCVTLIPFNPTLHTSIRDCTMFVSSSDYEGMSNSMLEALAIGLPTICTDCPAGGARAIITDGENGLLTPVGDAQVLCEAMKRVASSPELANKLSRNGAKLREQLSVQSIIKRWIDVL